MDLAHGIEAGLGADSLANRADSLIRAGRPWRATLLLAPALTVPTSATPAVRLAGARAAAGWNGWREVDRILRAAPWLDDQLEGEGRELVVRSALEGGQSPVDDARAAIAAARTDAQRVVRRVLLARAFDRANTRDSAAASYAGAAARLPDVADWLRLRAAGVESDSAARQARFARIISAPARARIRWTDAQARERTGDFVGAARVYRSVSAEPAALRVDALVARDESAKGALAARIAAYLARAPQPADARLALEVLDKLAASLSRADALRVARGAADAGVTARAIAGFERAAVGATLEPRDRFAYASALARAGRSADAVRAYDQLVSSDSSLAPSAAYQRARVLLQSGNGSAARSALASLASRYPAASTSAAPALLLLADLQVDDGDLAGAAKSLAELARRFPRASQAPLARFRAALLAWNGDAGRAALAFDSLSALYPRDEEALAARYWAGRAYDRLGRRTESRQRWSALQRDEPLSYYGVLSVRRLGAQPWSPPTGPDSSAHIPSVDSVAARVRTLRLLGLDVEARFELDALAKQGDELAASAPAIAEALSALGEPARALRLAVRLIERGGAVSRATYRVAYPVLHDDALVESARRTALDPALVAGLIRQESTWNPDAVSPVGARGLMQIMPSVGASLAAGRGYPLWNAALLFEPDVSLQLGTAHLAGSMHGGSESPARALAAYNAGASRVTRWSRRPGVEDPELFTEWIPFTETRDYVRVVQRNAAIYRALYGWR
ncbi:MAG: lytic transglycosylase domain-containing protein [bacterium]